MHIAGIRTDPGGAWMLQVARRQLGREGGFVQGSGGQLVGPPPGPGNDNGEPVIGPAAICSRSRLGGVLNFYHRDAARGCRDELPDNTP